MTVSMILIDSLDRSGAHAGEVARLRRTAGRA